MPTMLQDDQLRHHLPRAPRVLQPRGHRAHPPAGGPEDRQRVVEQRSTAAPSAVTPPTPAACDTRATSSRSNDQARCGSKSSTSSSTPTSRTGIFQARVNVHKEELVRSAQEAEERRASAFTSTARRQRATRSSSGAGSTTASSTRRRTKPRQVRRPDAGDRHSDRERRRIAQGAPRLLPRASLAFPGRDCRARARDAGRRRRSHLPPPDDRGGEGVGLNKQLPMRALVSAPVARMATVFVSCCPDGGRRDGQRLPRRGLERSDVSRLSGRQEHGAERASRLPLPSRRQLDNPPQGGLREPRDDASTRVLRRSRERAPPLSTGTGYSSGLQCPVRDTGEPIDEDAPSRLEPLRGGPNPCGLARARLCARAAAPTSAICFTAESRCANRGTWARWSGARRPAHRPGTRRSPEPRRPLGRRSGPSRAMSRGDASRCSGRTRYQRRRSIELQGEGTPSRSGWRTCFGLAGLVRRDHVVVSGQDSRPSTQSGSCHRPAGSALSDGRRGSRSTRSPR